MKNVIYQIRNVVNGKLYIGSAVDSKIRFEKHRRQLRKGKHHCAHLQASWNKHGEDCFKFEMLECVEGDLLEAEQRWIDRYYGKGNCYNTAKFAGAPMRGRTHTEEAKQRIQEALPRGQNHYRYGKPLDEEIRKKIGDTQRGKKKGPRTFTPEGLARAQENMRKNAREQKPVEFESVLAKFPEEIKARYDFTDAIYTGALVRIEGCVCPDHGIFSQYAAQFRKGRGCPSCGGDVRAQASKLRMKAAWSDPVEREKMMEARKKMKDWNAIRATALNEITQCVEAAGWAVKTWCKHNPDIEGGGIDVYLAPTRRGEDCHELARKITTLVGEKGFPFPYLDGESPANGGFWLYINDAD